VFKKQEEKQLHFKLSNVNSKLNKKTVVQGLVYFPNNKALSALSSKTMKSQYCSLLRTIAAQINN